MRATSARTLERVKICLEALVALKDDAVDDRILLDLNRQIAVVIADLDVGKQFGFEKIPNSLVHRLGCVGTTGAKLDV